MHVYFVRHGETDLNRRHIHQSPNTPLSSRGREIVVSTAEGLRVVNPDILVSSEYTRAIESARIIGLHVGLTPITNGLFYEIVRPSKLHNCSIFSLETLWYVFLSVLFRNRPSWRYKDAENFTDISNRAKRALAYIESLRDTHTSVVIVSHTVFINIMVAYMCRNRMLDVRDVLSAFTRSKRMKNGEVIHVEYVGAGAKNACNWRIVEAV